MQKRNISVGMITIGQSPRKDVRDDVEEILGERFDIVECGALDALSRNEIEELAPQEGEYVLVTRLRDGTEVRLSRNRIIERMQKCIRQLEQQVKAIVILCTGEFEDLDSDKLFIEPSLVIKNVVKALLNEGTLGVVVPSSDQIEALKRKWKRKGITVSVQALSPYEKTDEKKIKTIAERFKGENVDMIVLDCIGYSNETSKRFKQISEVPVVLSRTLVARIVKELL